MRRVIRTRPGRVVVGMAVAAALSSWLGAGTPVSAATQTAHYTVTFVATWSAQTHPANFPSSAHFSGLIGGTHNGSVSFWAPGQLATPGIEKMAEEGDKLTLQGEVQAAINAATAGEVISGGGISPSPGSVTQSFTIDLAHPLVTVVSMVAPTPDWFVGVHGLTLFENGDWVNQKSVVLLPYDSGTDDGTTYLSANLEASPHQSIGLITTLPLGNGATLGTMTFTRTDSAVPMQSGGLLVLMAACLGIAGAMFVARDRDLRRSASLLP